MDKYLTVLLFFSEPVNYFTLQSEQGGTPAVAYNLMDSQVSPVHRSIIRKPVIEADLGQTTSWNINLYYFCGHHKLCSYRYARIKCETRCCYSVSYRTGKPRLLTYILNLNSRSIMLVFSKDVNSSTPDLSDITFCSQMGGSRSYTLTGGSGCNLNSS